MSLQHNLTKRLIHRLAETSSPLYQIKLKDWTLPDGRTIPAWRASAPRTSDSGSTGAQSGWPTPTKGNGDGSQSMATMSSTGKRADGSKGTVSLPGVANLAGWPTAQARDWKGANNPDKQLTHNARPLNEVAKLVGWPTPQESHGPNSVDNLASAQREANRKSWGNSLHITAWATHGPTSTTTPAETAKPARCQLNPAFSRWLMGYPPSWCTAAVKAYRKIKSTQTRRRKGA